MSDHHRVELVHYLSCNTGQSLCICTQTKLFHTDELRSTWVQVSVKCGAAEKLLKVEEPSRCEYVATLLTPAACTPVEVQAIQDKLSALDSELEDAHSEL